MKNNKKKVVGLLAAALLAVSGVGVGLAFIINDANPAEGTKSAESAVRVSFGDATAVDITGLTSSNIVEKELEINWNYSTNATGFAKLTLTLAKGSLTEEETTAGNELGDINVAIAASTWGASPAPTADATLKTADIETGKESVSTTFFFNLTDTTTYADKKVTKYLKFYDAVQDEGTASQSDTTKILRGTLTASLEYAQSDGTATE